MIHNAPTPCDKAAEEYSNEHVWDNGGGSFFNKKEASYYSYKAGWSACNELMQSRIAELEAVYQQLKTKYMNEWDRVALAKKQIQSIEAKLAIANELINNVAGQVTWCDPTNQKVVLTYGFIVPDCQKYVATQLTKESK